MSSLDLTPDQAQALFHAGGFLIISDLPEGSEFSIDGTTHITRRFSGIKFLPPGLHLITWTPPPQHATGSNSTPAGPSAIPIRSGLIRYFQPKERYLLRYDPATESVLLPPAGDDTITAITDDRLRTLDREMAAYPFEGLETWKALTSEVTESILRDVVGDMGRLDGMTPVQGDEGGNGKDLNRRGKREWSGKEEQELAAMFGMGDERQLSFAQFDLKRSWRAGAVGEEVTRYSRDKSWLLGTVISRLGGDSRILLAHFQLAYIFLLHLSSYSSLHVYQRIMTLLCHSPSFLADPNSCSPAPASSLSESRARPISAPRMYTSLILTLAAQLRSLPPGVFESELPELDIFYLREINSLRRGLSEAMSCFSDVADHDPRSRAGWGDGNAVGMISAAWQQLVSVCQSIGWEVADLLYSVKASEISRAGVHQDPHDEEDEDEEGEYAPVVVEL